MLNMLRFKSSVLFGKHTLLKSTHTLLKSTEENSKLPFNPFFFNTST